jgi:DNA gyrase subunit A
MVKRVPYNNYVNKGRGGKGMAYMKITDKNGAAAGIRSVMSTDEIIITSQSGMTIRLLAGDISSQGRSTVGIRLLDINDTDTVSDFAVISEPQD